MDLSKLKSAVILTDVEEACAKLVEAAASQEGSITGAAIEDGRVRVRAARANAARPSVKDRLSDMAARAYAEQAGLRWTDEMKGRTVPYWMSDERPDAHGDIVRQNWHFDLFDKNPVSVFSHDWGGLPIGAIIHKEVVKRADVDYQGPALFGQDLFAPASVSEFADAVFRLVDAGFLRGCSVGFISDKVIVVQDDEERAQLGLGKFGLILDDNHLLELSPTTLGANPGAHSVLTQLAKAKQRGALTPRSIAVVREISRRELVARGKKDAAAAMDQQLVAYSRALIPGLDIKAAREVEKSLLDREEWDRETEKARRTWVNVSVATEETDGDEDAEPEEKPEGEKALAEGLKAAFEGGDAGLLEFVKAHRKELEEELKDKTPPIGSDDEEPEEDEKSTREMLEAVLEMLVGMSDSMGRLAQSSEDVRAMLETMASAGAGADDSDGDGDGASSVDVEALRGAAGAIDRLRQRLAV